MEARTRSGSGRLPRERGFGYRADVASDPTPLGPGPAVNLAAFRIAVVATWLVALDPHNAAAFAHFPQELLFPTGFWHGRLKGLDYPPELVWALYAAFMPAALAALVGWRTRAALWVMLLAGGTIIALPQFFGKIVHNHHLLWFALLLALSPSGDALSLDARWRRRRGEPEPTWSRAYAWPLRAATLLIAIAYFFPGYWKLASVGWDWARAENFIGIMHGKWFETYEGDPTFRIDRYPGLCGLAAKATIIFELTFLPLALWKRTRLLVIAMGITFHLGVYLVMDIAIGHLAVGYAAMIPWHRWIASSSNSSSGAMPSDARRDVRRGLPVAVAGLVLIAGNIYDGMHRREDWPLCIYPTFAGRAQSQRATLVIEARMPDGTIRELTEPRLGVHLRPSRARGLAQNVLADEQRRDTRFRALWRVWLRVDPSLVSATSARFVIRTVSTVPEQKGTQLAPDVELLVLDFSQPPQPGASR